MLHVNISFQFGLKLGGWTNSGLNALFLFFLFSFFRSIFCFFSNFLNSLQLTLLEKRPLTGLFVVLGRDWRENRPLIDFKPPVFRGSF